MPDSSVSFEPLASSFFTVILQTGQGTGMADGTGKMNGFTDRLFPEHHCPQDMPGGRKWPRISVIIPSLNQGEFIEETILSLLNQNYADLEIIVIDGESVDDTPGIINKYSDKIEFWISEPDNGQADAINKGMQKATGDILTWLNSDDCLARDALKAVALAFEVTGADMVAGGVDLVRDGNITERHMTCAGDGELSLEELLDIRGCWEEGQFFYQPEVMFRRDLWLRAGGYVAEQYDYCFDYELWLRFAQVKARLCVIGRPVAEFRIHEAQKTTNRKAVKSELESIRRQYTGHERSLEKKNRVASAPRNSTLRILMVNDVGFHRGAGIAHRRLAECLQASGHKVQCVSLADPGTRQSDSAGAVKVALQKIIGKFEPDCALVGNLHGVVDDVDVLEPLLGLCPVIPVAHDFWWITGRCAYPKGCDRFFEGCDDRCPTPYEYPALGSEKIAPAHARKQRMFSERNIPALISHPGWPLQVHEDWIFRHRLPMSVLPVRLGIDISRFCPGDKLAEKRALGIDPERPVLLVIADQFSDIRKGGPDLVTALKSLSDLDYQIIAAGECSEPLVIAGKDIHYAGYVKEEEDLVRLYRASDILLNASGPETFGQVLVEAAACGLPAVTYGTTGLLNAVRGGVTGLVVRPDPAALAAACRTLLEDPQRRKDLGFQACLYAGNFFSRDACAWSLQRIFMHPRLASSLNIVNHLSINLSQNPDISVTGCSAAKDFASAILEPDQVLEKRLERGRSVLAFSPVARKTGFYKLLLPVARKIPGYYRPKWVLFLASRMVALEVWYRRRYQGEFKKNSDNNKE